MYMPKRGIFIFIILALSLDVGAQYLSHKVLVSAGNVVLNGDYSLSQTVGEPVVELISNENFILTQGFQQPGALVFKPNDKEGKGVRVYPNPVQDRLMLELFGDTDLEYHVTIFGFNGAIYLKNDYLCEGNFWHVVTLDVSNYQRGTYFVRVVTECGSISRLFKIQKM
jgi:hypothetical protein